MGGSSWSASSYGARLSAAKAAGRSTFDHHDQVRTGRTAAKAHELLDPLAKAGPSSRFAGKVMREVCISTEHPNPTPIAIVLDVTGSNIEAARAVHAKLPQLFGVLQRIGGIEDPQILIAATGDANTDQVPVQFGQFESDNRVDDQVSALYLEGNGGGQSSETYELIAYLLANHTHLEPVEKQGRKGYAIFIGDEKPYDAVRRSYGRHTLESLTGDVVEADISTKDVFAKLDEQFHVFYLFQMQGNYGRMGDEKRILAPWRELLGDNALTLEDPNAVCEFVAGLLAKMEGGLDDDDIVGALTAAGFDAKTSAIAGKTLATVGGGGGAVAKIDGGLDIADSTGTDRL
jgi:hypothetical protein